jgi:putative transposase
MIVDCWVKFCYWPDFWIILKNVIMANTYSQLYIQIVFAVKGREHLIAKVWQDELYKYMAGIITQKGHKSIIVNGWQDHVHLFVGIKPSMAIADLVRDVNNKQWLTGNFAWQEGYGAFSYAHSQI